MHNELRTNRMNEEYSFQRFLISLYKYEIQIKNP